MPNQLSKIKMVDVNKTVVFYSPIEGEDVLVRTGTIADGSCFFHALLHAYSNEYKTMDVNGRSNYVRRLRASMAGKMDRESWEEIGGGLIAKIPFQENVISVLNNFYSYISNDKRMSKMTERVMEKLLQKDDIQVYKIVTELLSLEELEQNILPKSYSNCEKDNIETCKNTIINDVSEYMDNLDTLTEVEKSKSQYIKTACKNFITQVLDESEDRAFKSYVKGLKTVSADVDTYTISLISDRFNRDIYFIDAKNRMPYRQADSNNLKGRKSMIVMWVGGVHYEIVGRLLSGNRIQREFNASDPLIKKLNTFVCKPEDISSEYPDLVPYLPKEYRERFKESPYQSSDESEDNYHDESS